MYFVIKLVMITIEGVTNVILFSLDKKKKIFYTYKDHNYFALSCVLYIYTMKKY